MDIAPHSLKSVDTAAEGSRFSMTKARKDGLIFLVLGCGVFVFLGTIFAITHPMVTDLESYYYTARCLIHGQDPYIEANVMRIYAADGHDPANQTEATLQVVTRSIYPPPILTFTVPMAFFPLKVVAVTSTLLKTTGLCVAAFLMWDLAADWAPVIGGFLLGFALANSEFVMLGGNFAGIAISLCIIAVWCFLRNRFVLLGLTCMASSLAIKPHEGWLVWLFFCVAGGIYRRRALQTLVVFMVMSLPVTLWVTLISPHWPQELHNNMELFSVRGGMMDQGLTYAKSNTASLIIDLQSAVAFFSDDPKFCNAVSYLICGALTIWCFLTTRRARITDQTVQLALVIIAPLSMLPVYHRVADTKLLLLAVPGTALLGATAGRIGRIGLAVTFAALVATADILWAVMYMFLARLHGPNLGLGGQFRIAIQVLPAPLAMLAMAVFYLWVYATRARGPSSTSPTVLIATKAV